MKVINYKNVYSKLTNLNKKIYKILANFVKKENIHIMSYEVDCEETKIEIYVEDTQTNMTITLKQPQL